MAISHLAWHTASRTLCDKTMSRVAQARDKSSRSGGLGRSEHMQFWVSPWRTRRQVGQQTASGSHTFMGNPCSREGGTRSSRAARRRSMLSTAPL